MRLDDIQSQRDDSTDPDYWWDQDAFDEQQRQADLAETRGLFMRNPHGFLRTLDNTDVFIVTKNQQGDARSAWVANVVEAVQRNDIMRLRGLVHTVATNVAESCEIEDEEEF